MIEKQHQRNKLPPPIPPPDAGGTAALKKEEIGDVAPTPATAPLFLRALAFLMDWVLAGILFAALLKWLVLPNHSSEATALVHWWNDTLDAYKALLAHAESGKIQGAATSWAEASAFSNKALSRFPTDSNVTSFIARLGLLQTLHFWAFFFACEYLSKGASLGKRVFHLRVASTNDMGAPGFMDSLLRGALKSVLFCSPNTLMLLVGVINAHVPLFNPQRRAWHDRLSRTIVVDANTAPLQEEKNSGDACGTGG
ncbi:MAG: RDD family protein [Puniceicoccales bacterium]|jgi:uncharacterized RDD family membrane protein YckC|nr:RDD family protein [Puniceicoccales bacterium]